MLDITKVSYFFALKLLASYLTILQPFADSASHRTAAFSLTKSLMEKGLKLCKSLGYITAPEISVVASEQARNALYLVMSDNADELLSGK